MVQLQAAMAAAAPGLRICWRGLASGKTRAAAAGVG